MGYFFFFALGGSVGFLSGLLGLGGGIVMFPVLLYLPPLLGLEAVGVRDITGLTMVQGFSASLSAMLYYRRHGFVSRPLVLGMGIPIFAASLAGAVLSRYVPEDSILLVFGLLAISASAMMFIPRRGELDELTSEGVAFNRPLAAAIGVALGVVLGMVGQGGAFIMIPVLLYVLRVPLRVAMGSALAIGLFSSTAGLIGKAATGQVPLYASLAMLAGSVPAARLGGMVGRRTDTRYLRWLLALVITASAVKISLDIFAQF